MIKKSFIFIVFFMLIIPAHADEKNKRKVWNIIDNGQSEQGELAVPFPGGNAMNIQVFSNEYLPDSVVLVPNLKKLSSEEKYFEALTLIFRQLLKSYKIGKADKKEATVMLTTDLKLFPAPFHIKINHLKLLNNRDFGPNDLMAFEKSLVYPLKYILKKGKFVGKQEDIQLTKRYHKFLDQYDISPLIEPAIEAWFAKKKIK